MLYAKQACELTVAHLSMSSRALTSLGFSKACSSAKLHAKCSHSAECSRRAGEQHDMTCAVPHLVKPFPSTLTTIQQCGSKRSSVSKCFTYSKRLFAMNTSRQQLKGH